MITPRFTLACFVIAARLATAQPGPVLGTVVPTPPNPGPGAASPAASEPAIPDNGTVQIVAQPQCHIVIGDDTGYRNRFASATPPLAPPSGCLLSSATASAIDRDLSLPAGISGPAIDEVTTLIAEALKAGTGPAAALVHLLRYAEPKDGAQAVARDVWLACDGKSAKPTDLRCSTNLRLLGRKAVHVVFVHTNIAFDLDPTLPADRLAALANLPAGQTAYFATAEAKLPVPLENLQGVLRVSAGAVAAALPARVALYGSGRFYKMPVPSKLAIVAARNGASGASRVGSKAEVLNEGHYLLDFSIGVPVTKLSATEFVSEGSTFQPKSIDRRSIYGLANFYPFPVDLSSGTKRYLIPRAVFGVGLVGNFGRNFLVGGSLGPPFLQFFVGSEFVQKEFQTAGGVTEKRYRSRFTFGLNIPVNNALRKLQAAAAQ